MARWQLTEACYFKTIPPSEWEYKETSSDTGRLSRIVLEVPTLLIENTIVCHQGKGLPTDTVFVGPPTSTMTPLDDEAQEISNKMRPGWDHPIESLPGQGPAALSPETLAMMDSFAKSVGEAVKPPVQAISRDEFNLLKAQITALTKQNDELKAAAKRV